MAKPVIIVNFKNYQKASGQNALKLAKICEKVSKELKADIRIAVAIQDIRMITSKTSIPVYAQHVDGIVPGSYTGWILPEAVKEAGAVGTLLNHSEHSLQEDVLKKTFKRATEIGLKVIICAKNAEIGKTAALFKPEFVAVEPPELIGGDISVSTAQPELISKAVKMISKERGCNLLVGAGVKTGEDLKISLALGAKGVLLASGIAKKPKDPEAALRKLLDY